MRSAILFAGVVGGSVLIALNVLPFRGCNGCVIRTVGPVVPTRAAHDGFVQAYRGQPSENTMALSGKLYWRTLRHVAHIGWYSRHQKQLMPIDLAGSHKTIAKMMKH